MKKLLKKNQKIWMVPEDIKGALSANITKISGSVIEFSINKKDIKYYKLNDKVEMFSIVDEGMLYFKPLVKEINKEENIVKVEFEKKEYELLQRREYTRIELEKEFTLKDGDKEHVCKAIDVSAGGMKFITEAMLMSEKDYTVEFSLESNIPIQCFFKPIRVDEMKEETKAVKTKKSDDATKNIVSGRFVALKNIDKIAIVQFCFKKQMENTNR